MLVLPPPQCLPLMCSALHLATRPMNMEATTNGVIKNPSHMTTNKLGSAIEQCNGMVRSALILYASETGTSEDAAHSLGRMFERLYFDVEVKAMDEAQLSDLLHFGGIIVFCVSTTGQGDIPSNGAKFWKNLLRKKLPARVLSTVSFTTFGFGDSSYPKFNWAARKLHKRLEQLGAQEIYGRGESDEQHDDGTDGAFLPWSRDLRNWLLQEYPLSGEGTGYEPIPDSKFLEPKFVLTIDDCSRDKVETARVISLSLSSDGDHVSVSKETAGVTQPAPPQRIESASLDADELEPAYAASDPTSIDSQVSSLQNLNISKCKPDNSDIPPPLLLPIPNSNTLTLTANARFTPPNHWQDVRQITLTQPSQFTYKPGDTLTIYPKNFPNEVEKLITEQGWDNIADCPLLITSNPARCPPNPKTNIDGSLVLLPEPDYTCLPVPLTVRNLLLHTLDISKIPSRYFLELCAHFSDDPDHRERLLEFSNPAFSDEYYDYCTRPRRSIMEVLSDFHSVKLPWRYVLSIFPRIRGRQFSIASGGQLKHGVNNQTGEEETRIDLLIAIVKYRTVLRKIREGLCSRYISALPLGTQLQCTIQPASWDLRKDHYAMLKSPLLCVGPGTGVAPIRALMHERTAVLDLYGHEMGSRAVLIYGGRNREADFFYGDEWEGLGVEVHTAWSRDQREKVYVQDILRQRPDVVWDCLGPKDAMSENGQLGGDGTFFVCGSSGKMPISVRAALVDALVASGMERVAAEAHLKAMEKANKYLQETW